MTRSDRRQWRPRVNLLREGFSCSTLTFATLFTAIERRIADIRARCGVQLSRLRRDQRAKTGASVEVSTIVCRSASSGLCASERRRWQLLAIAVCLCAIGHRRSYDETSDDLLAAIDMPACKCRMDVGQMMAFNATQAWISCRDCVSASWRRIRSAGKRRFNSMAPFSAPSPGIELGFDSSVDLNGESGLWKFVRTRSHAEVQNFAL